MIRRILAGPRPLGPYAGGEEEARRALSRRRRRRRRRAVLAWALLGLCAAGFMVLTFWGGHLGLGWVGEHTRLLDVERVDVEPTRWVPPWELAELCGVSPGDDIMGVDPESVAVCLIRHPRVASALVRRDWNRTVHLAVEEKPPVAFLLGAGSLEVAADGTVLGPPPHGPRPEWPSRGQAALARGLELPLLTGVVLQEPRPGARINDEGARRALQFLARLREYGRPGESWISEVWVGDPDDLVVVTLEDGIPVRIGDGRLTRRKVEALEAVLEQIRGGEAPEPRNREKSGKKNDKNGDIQGAGTGPVVLVDARFRNQVIVKRS